MDELLLPDDFAVRSRTVLATIIRDTHRRRSGMAVAMADEHGAFGSAGMSPVFPVVIDANALRDELLRIVRTGQRTILWTAANSGVLRLYCAWHVVDEVNEHLVDWARRKRLDPAAVWTVWRTIYQPLLRVVDVFDDLTTPAEGARLATLADSTAPDGDPDDVPTATLALLLGAPLLSQDRKPLRAVYGPGVDHAAHAKWLSALAAGGDLGPLSTYLQLSSLAVVGIGKGAVAGFRALARCLPWPWFVTAVAACGLSAYWMASDATGQLGSRAGRFLLGALDLMTAIYSLHNEAEREFSKLAAPRPQWDEIRANLTGDQQLQRRCLYDLARAPGTDLSAAELYDALSIRAAEQRIRATMRAGDGFVQVYAGRFQVGRALVTASPDQHPVEERTYVQGQRMPSPPR
jgi:predicted nucleic acid-binding protein